MVFERERDINVRHIHITRCLWCLCVTGTFTRTGVNKLIYGEKVPKLKELPLWATPNVHVYAVTSLRSHSNCLCGSSTQTKSKSMTDAGETEPATNESEVPSTASRLQERSSKISRCIRSGQPSQFMWTSQHMCISSVPISAHSYIHGSHLSTFAEV